MFFIKFGHNASIQQVEGFPKGCERSCIGALHVRPWATKTVTKAELERLQELKIPLMVIDYKSEKEVVEPEVSESIELPHQNVDTVSVLSEEENYDLTDVEDLVALESHSVDSKEGSSKTKKKGKNKKKY